MCIPKTKKLNYCAIHNFLISRSKVKPCLRCSKGTWSKLQICTPCVSNEIGVNKRYHTVIKPFNTECRRLVGLSTYDFSTLYTTLPHNLIKDKLVDLIERTFQREGSLYIACNDKMLFSHLMQSEIIIYGLVRKCVKLSPFS